MCMHQTPELQNMWSRILQNWKKRYANPQLQPETSILFSQQLIELNKTSEETELNTTINQDSISIYRTLHLTAEYMLFKRHIGMANKHLKRCSTLLVMKQMQIKTTFTIHLSGWLKWQKKTPNADVDTEKSGSLIHCQWERKTVQPLWNMVWQFHKKIKHATIIWPSSCTTGHSSWGMKTYARTKMFIVALLVIAQGEN